MEKRCLHVLWKGCYQTLILEPLSRFPNSSTQLVPLSRTRLPAFTSALSQMKTFIVYSFWEGGGIGRGLLQCWSHFRDFSKVASENFKVGMPFLTPPMTFARVKLWTFWHAQCPHPCSSIDHGDSRAGWPSTYVCYVANNSLFTSDLHFSCQITSFARLPAQVCQSVWRTLKRYWQCTQDHSTQHIVGISEIKYTLYTNYRNVTYTPANPHGSHRNFQDLQ